MGFLSEPFPITYKYECPEGHVTRIETTSNAEKQNDVVCDCGKSADYAGFDSIKMGGATKVAFEHNGVQGYRIVDSKGHVTHRAKSKDDYINKGMLPDQGRVGQGSASKGRLR